MRCHCFCSCGNSNRFFRPKEFPRLPLPFESWQSLGGQVVLYGDGESLELFDESSCSLNLDPRHCPGGQEEIAPAFRGHGEASAP
jgi:hypothetical protein